MFWKKGKEFRVTERAFDMAITDEPKQLMLECLDFMESNPKDNESLRLLEALACAGYDEAQLQFAIWIFENGKNGHQKKYSLIWIRILLDKGYDRFPQTDGFNKLIDLAKAREVGISADEMKDKELISDEFSEASLIKHMARFDMKIILKEEK